MKRFRLLKANEIECRVAQVKKDGLSLLLYKDARVDQNILDETVGWENWQRRHTLIDGQLFCEVGVRIIRGEEEGCKYGEWIWKQDVGVESYTEKEKGRASDAFKRACFNLGIGRELYTAPFIWIASENKGGVARITEKGTGFTCYDKFYVSEIGYAEDESINMLVINKGYGTKNDPVAYTFGKKKNLEQKPNINDDLKTQAVEKLKATAIGKAKAEAFKSFLKDNGIGEAFVLGSCKVETLAEITEGTHAWLVSHVNEIKKGYDEWKAKAD